MGCCGQKRRQLHNALPAPAPRRGTAGGAVGGAPSGTPVGRARPATTAPVPAGRRSAYAYFRYTGKTALTAYGPISGRSYRFERTGAVVAVDPRDRRSLAAVPSLIQVPAP